MIHLQIAYDEKTGNIQVKGPLTNKGACYMLLELAKDEVRNYKPPSIVPAQMVPQIQGNGHP